MSAPQPAASPGAPRWQVHQIPRIAESAVARARLRVVPRRRTRAARLPFVTLVSLVLLGGVVGLLCLNTNMQQSAFAQTALDNQAASLAARQQTLLIENQRLMSPQHIAEAAQSHALGGMTLPTSTCQLDLGVAKAVHCPTDVPVVDPATTKLRLFARPPRPPHLPRL